VTTLRNGFFVILIALVAGALLFNSNKDKGGTKDANGDDGVRVTFTVTVRDFAPGDEKPRVHYRMQNVAPQPEQLSADEGIPVDQDGNYRKSLGIVKKGTYVMVWVTEPRGMTKKPIIVCNLYFDGKLVDQDSNRTDTVVVCEKEVA